MDKNELNTRISDPQHGDHRNGIEGNIGGLNKIIRKNDKIQCVIGSKNENVRRTNFKKKSTENALEQAELNQIKEVDKWNRDEKETIDKYMKLFDRKRIREAINLTTNEIEDLSVHQQNDKFTIFRFCDLTKWLICIISNETDHIYYIGTSPTNGKTLETFIDDKLMGKEYIFSNIPRKTNDENKSYIVLIKFLDKLLSSNDSLKELLNKKKHKNMKKINQLIDEMDNEEIKIYEEHLENKHRNNILPIESHRIEKEVETSTFLEIEEKNNKNLPIVIGNLKPPILVNDKDVLEWFNELRMFFANNHIPEDMHLSCARMALNPNDRAKVEMHEKYTELKILDCSSLISFLFKETKGEDIGMHFCGMTRKQDENASCFLLRLDNVYDAGFICEQFIAGINNERMARKLLSSQSKSIF
ncbi:hypothetical protein SNEBB_005882 [Seison nebaliae]|nr:hypothetical protein SNEBB_005882 [Seison nebaliae]